MIPIIPLLLGLGGLLFLSGSSRGSSSGGSSGSGNGGGGAGPGAGGGGAGATAVYISDELPILKKARRRVGVPEEWQYIPIEASRAGRMSLNAAQGQSLYAQAYPKIEIIDSVFNGILNSNLLSMIGAGDIANVEGFLKSMGDLIAVTADEVSPVVQKAQPYISSELQGFAQIPPSIINSLSPGVSVTVFAPRTSKFLTNVIGQLSYFSAVPEAKDNLRFIGPLSTMGSAQRAVLSSSIIAEDYAQAITQVADAAGSLQGDFTLGNVTSIISLLQGGGGLVNIAPLVYLVSSIIKDPYTVIVAMRHSKGVTLRVFSNGKPSLPFMGVDRDSLGFPAFARPTNKQPAQSQQVAEALRNDLLGFL